MMRVRKLKSVDMQRWDEDGLWLFSPEEYKQLPDGTELTCIDSTTAIKGKDKIDMDTRFGYLAYGVKNPYEHELKHLFLIFGLQK